MSLCISTGKPTLAKIERKVSTTWAEPSFFNTTASGNFVAGQSTLRMYLRPSNYIAYQPSKGWEIISTRHMGTFCFSVGMSGTTLPTPHLSTHPPSSTRLSIWPLSFRLNVVMTCHHVASVISPHNIFSGQLAAQNPYYSCLCTVDTTGLIWLRTWCSLLKCAL